MCASRRRRLQRAWAVTTWATGVARDGGVRGWAQKRGPPAGWLKETLRLSRTDRYPQQPAATTTHRAVNADFPGLSFPQSRRIRYYSNKFLLTRIKFIIHLCIIYYSRWLHYLFFITTSFVGDFRNFQWIRAHLSFFILDSHGNTKSYSYILVSF